MKNRLALPLRALLLATLVAPGAVHARNVLVLPSYHRASGAEVAEALRRDGEKVELADWVERALGGTGALSVGALDAAIPEAWPASLRATWVGAVNACKTEAGKPPYGVRNRGAFLCGRRIAPALLQRYLEARAPDLVLEIHLRLAREGDEPNTMRLAAYGPRETRQRVLSATFAEESDAPALAVTLARRLLAGEGERAPRTVTRELPSVPDAALPPPTLEASEVEAVGFSHGCTAPLPQEMKVTAEDPLQASAVGLTWSATIAQPALAGAGRGSAACSVFFEDLGSMAAGLHSLRGELHCPGTSAEVRYVGVRVAGHDASLKLARKLVGAYLSKVCGGKPDPIRRPRRPGR